MTAGQVIEVVDALLPNAYTTAQKLGWLQEAEGMVASEITLKAPPDVAGGGEDTPLTACPPYTALYSRYLEAMIFYYNGDYAAFNNAMAMYSAMYAAYGQSYRKAALPHHRTCIR